MLYMAKKTSFALKQLIPEDNPKTGTKYIIRKPTKGLKVGEKLRMKKYSNRKKKQANKSPTNNQGLFFLTSDT